MRRIALLLAVLEVAPTDSAVQPARLEITYLANMGVLLSGGGKHVVIDGLHHGELDDYATVPPSLLTPLEQGRAPYATIDLVLTTHRHLDHFNAASVAARLAADSTTIFVAAQETVDSLYARTRLRPTPRVRGVVPPAQGEMRVSVPGIDLTVIDLPHNATRSRRVANVGFLVSVGGLRILHVGDADPTAANFDPHRLGGRAIDVAIVPFWYLTGNGGVMVRSIGAKQWIATHVPPSDAASIRKDVQKAIPGAIVLTAPGERHSIR